jgi:hypothetical protein
LSRRETQVDVDKMLDKMQAEVVVVEVIRWSRW